MITFGSDSVRSALRAGRPLVALETAVLTHGLPRPANLAALQRMEDAVRSAGATPAVVGVLSGKLIVGMTPDQISALAADPNALKLSARDLALALDRNVSGGTTVAATLVACRLAGIRVFATGGIGGVHRGWAARPDLSADLLELSRSPVCVIASGPKAILDVPATLEMLETLSVPVLGWKTDLFPQFYSVGSPDLRVQHRIDAESQVAHLCRRHWNDLRLPSALLLCNPVPAAFALDHALLERTIADALRSAAAAGVTGPNVTPWLLSEVSRLTAGQSQAANLALLESNAALAARIACALAK